MSVCQFFNFSGVRPGTRCGGMVCKNCLSGHSICGRKGFWDFSCFMCGNTLVLLSGIVGFVSDSSDLEADQGTNDPWSDFVFGMAVQGISCGYSSFFTLYIELWNQLP